jgi:uncharacterized membrane protein YeaQ/YmgE (transglycosylase-associated protein family)
MPTDARIALLVVGIILLAIAVIGAVAAAARKNSRRAGRIQRAVIGVVGAALIVWVVMVWPRAVRLQPATSAAASAPVAATPAAPAPAAASAPPGAASAVPAHPDLVFLADSVFDGCSAPSRPAELPNGATATRQQMQASQAAARAFDAATDSYQTCLNNAARNFVGQYGRGMDPVNLRAVDNLHTKMNNAAVDIDQSVANQFNQQLRVFKARSGT